jgi:hypothetical protein
LIADDSAGRIAKELWWTNEEFSSADIIPPWFSMLTYHPRMNKRPVGDRRSETSSHPLDMSVVILSFRHTFSK